MTGIVSYKNLAELAWEILLEEKMSSDKVKGVLSEIKDAIEKNKAPDKNDHPDDDVEIIFVRTKAKNLDKTITALINGKTGA